MELYTTTIRFETDDAVELKRTLKIAAIMSGEQSLNKFLVRAVMRELRRVMNTEESTGRIQN